MKGNNRVHGLSGKSFSYRVVLFEGFELLDVFGPLELFGALTDRYSITLIGPVSGPVASAQDPQVVADVSYADALLCDLVLVPGVRGAR